MRHTLTLEVPEAVYEPLTQKAKQTGVTPEAVAVEWLIAASRVAREDPLEKFIGAFPSKLPDWADQHDKFLGEALMNQLPNQETP